MSPTQPPTGTTSPPTGTGTASPPAGTGTVTTTAGGLYVKAGLIYDSKGVPFMPQGVNQLHFDNGSANYAPKSGANIVRYWFDSQTEPMASHLTNIGKYLAASMVVCACQPSFSTGVETNDQSSFGKLPDVTAWWVANAATLAPLLNKHGIVNIANEYGAANSSAWASDYATSVVALRAAGYTGLILIDSGGYGQDLADINTYGTAVYKADPLKNIAFSLHVYGNATTVTTGSTLATLRAGTNAAGYGLIIGEVGPGRNIGPSPTMITPQAVWAAAQAQSIGLLGWAWDDNNLANGASSQTSFSMTLAGPGTYNTAADLTEWGQQWLALLAAGPAKKATDF